MDLGRLRSSDALTPTTTTTRAVCPTLVDVGILSAGTIQGGPVRTRNVGTSSWWRMNLIDIIQDEERRLNPHPWTPVNPPSLDGIRDIELDTETTGLAWWAKDRPIGIALRIPDGRSWYLPWGHRGGGNLDEGVVKRWAQRELRSKRITNLNIKFDIHMLRSWGVDLEEQGNEVSDVGHYAALLDDHRKRFSLESIAQDYLGMGKIQGLDKTRMASYHAGEVADYAKQDVILVGALREKLWPLLTEQDLHRVRALEDRVIFPVCEMEKNGTLLDVERLERWIEESEQAYLRCLWKIQRETGVMVNPAANVHADKIQLFERLGLPLPRAVGGGVTFKDSEIRHIQHPTVQLMRRATKLKAINSKLRKYKQHTGPDGILRYSLHQLRAEKDQNSDGSEAGTISGRFSSTEVMPGVGDNIQAIMKAAKQRVAFGYEEEDDSHDEEIFIIRKLHIPASGLHLSADAEQVEYRIFAHFAENPKVLAAYAENPRLHFHKFMWNLMKVFKPDLTYRQQKDLNFAYIYGAGLVKLALMMGFVTEAQAEQLRKERARGSHPLLRQASEIKQIYEREIPEGKAILGKAMHLAKEACDEDCRRDDIWHRARLPHRGYVRTILGRRTRFPGSRRLHKAFNGVDQGSGADINKLKLVEIHNERKNTGFLMRFTVHDEVDGDCPDQECARKIEAILNRQSVPMRVPILWSVGTGANWADCK